MSATGRRDVQQGSTQGPARRPHRDPGDGAGHRLGLGRRGGGGGDDGDGGQRVAADVQIDAVRRCAYAVQHDAAGERGEPRPRRSTGRSCAGRCRARSAGRSRCGCCTRTAPAPTPRAGASQSVKPNGTGIETFSTQLPIRSGDMIAVDSSNPTDEIGVADVTGASLRDLLPAAVRRRDPGRSQTKAGRRSSSSAEVQPAPAITSVSPAEGSVTGRRKGDDHRHQPERRQRA